MVLVGEGLNNALHEILLGERVLADGDDLQDFWEHASLVDIVSESFET